MRAIDTLGDHANGQLAHLLGLAGPDAADATTLTGGHATLPSPSWHGQRT